MGGAPAGFPRASSRSPGRGDGFPPPGDRPFPSALPWVLLVATLTAIPVVALFAPTPNRAPSPSLSEGAHELAAAAHSLALGAGPATGLPLACTPSVSNTLRCGSTFSSTARGGATNSTPIWVGITPALNRSPTVRESASLAYDPALKEVVLFGGQTDGRIPLGETWTYVNATWTELQTGNSTPPARWGAGFVFDDEQVPGLLLLFGGRNATHFFNDTWEFSATGWRALPPSLSPGPRAFPALGFDERAQEAVLFGGTRAGLAPQSVLVLADTWVFRAGTWTNVTLSQATSPPAARGASFAVDAGAGGLLLHGGNGALRCSPTAGTWRFNAGSWSNVTANFGGAQPPATFGGAWLNDSADHQFLAFGGFGNWAGTGCGANNVTWSLHNGTWTNLTTSAGNAPSPRLFSATTFDGLDGYTLLFGGNLSGSGIDSSETFAFSARPVNGSTNHGSSNNSTAALTALLQATPADGV
ncbi:MAG: hypothetical protein L3K15_08865, partial [Thermoplasmata archaeon]|nr:hypothetical protein [Thermoplasmata archaeon]